MDLLYQSKEEVTYIFFSYIFLTKYPKTIATSNGSSGLLSGD